MEQRDVIEVLNRMKEKGSESFRVAEPTEVVYTFSNYEGTVS